MLLNFVEGVDGAWCFICGCAHGRHLEKQQIENVSKLIEDGEAAISNERLAWNSTGGQQSEEPGRRVSEIDVEKVRNCLCICSLVKMRLPVCMSLNSWQP